MDKNAIKKFATKARHELISRVSQRAFRYGISDKEEGNADDETVNEHPLSFKEKEQRAALIAQIKAKGYKQVMEEVAYTWFNRFSALRFMEVNGYLPTKVRVFTDEENEFNPQILTEAMHMELSGLDREKVYAYKEANNNDELYKYLLITQCNALGSILPGMFQKISDYTELLFPDNLLRKGSVIHQMIEQIPEDDWKDQVQIIGWLYQYYNSEKKDEVFALLKKNVKITKENIPAATQLFTPDWIVRYMVENSLGRLWLEGHPDDGLKSQWKYYIEEAEQETKVKEKLAEIRKEYATLTPDSLKVIDPCSGSGHILAYMFDVLMKIYESYGYATRDAVISIMENNLYGLDIDERAAQLAYFSVMMKGRQYDRRFFSRGIQPHVYAIEESNHVDPNVVDYYCNGNAKLKKSMDTIIKELHDAKEYGSIITVGQQDWDALYARFDEIRNERVTSIYSESAYGLKRIVEVAEALAKKFHVCVTNPPYMGIKNMSATLAEHIRKTYPNNKYDIYGIFIETALKKILQRGYVGLVTQQTFMFLSRYEYLRNEILRNDIINFIQMGTRAFDDIGGEVVQTASYVIRKSNTNSYLASYVNLSECNSTEEKEHSYLNCPQVITHKKEDFSLIVGSPLAYWVSPRVCEIFHDNINLESIAFPRQGMATSDNDRFLRLWFEVCNSKIGLNYKNREAALESHLKWFPYNKGGGYRKWYGNAEYVVNWENDGFEIKAFRDYKNSTLDSNMGVAGLPFIFKENITWSKVCSAQFSVRYLPEGFLFDVSGCSIYAENTTLRYIMGLLNSKVINKLLSAISQSLNFEVGSIKMLPVIQNETCNLGPVYENVRIAKLDWDSFETSWDFKRHPLLQYAGFTPQMIAKEESNGYLILNGIADAYRHWKQACDDRFNQLKANEEELNRIFIDIYGLQDELTPEVEDKDVTVRKADLERDIKSFISYAVGCMFGRYSLDVEGLAYAGGDWDASKYATFAADKDNIIPICDDEYFEDDIVGRFVKFVEVVYGKETLQENLKFIADALGGNGTPKEIIRNYFLNGFYKNHCKTYQKRPIYWLFDSGKKNGFKCLIYMHRYQPDLLARIRTDYVHEQQSRYHAAIAGLESRIDHATTAERVKLNKQLKALTEQEAEIHEYEEKIHHLADQMISIDPDDGVKNNYAIFKDVLAKIR